MSWPLIFFNDNKILKLLGHDDPDSSTYVLQYFFDTKEKYDRYISEFDAALRKKSFRKMGK